MNDDIAAIAKLSVPLADKLVMLREAALRAGPTNPMLTGWAAAHPAIARGDDWLARAWWGAAAGEVVRDYLYDQQRRPAALELVDEVDSRALGDAIAKGRGLIVVTAHIGPPKFLMNWLLGQQLPLLVWTNTHDLPAWLATSARATLVDPRDEERKSVVLINSALHLRRQGVLLGAADMATGDRQYAIERFGFTRTFSFGLPVLARKLGVPTVAALALWRGNRIAIEFAPVAPPDASLQESEWMTRWLERSWAFVEPILLESPENLRFLRSAVRPIARPWDTAAV